MFTSLNTAAFPCSVPTISFNIHSYKKDRLLPHRKHSVSIRKSSWLLLFTQMFILRIIQRNAQMHCVISFGFLTPKDGTDRLSRNVGKKLTTTRCVITQKSAVLFTEIHCFGIVESFSFFLLLVCSSCFKLL